MNNNTTKIIDPESGEKREFTFDYSFWSHDGCSMRDDVIFLIKGLFCKRNGTLCRLNVSVQ
jgi:hypothetical protein